MKCLETFIYLLLATIIGGPAVSAQALSVDWKFYGSSSLDRGAGCFNFYDAEGIVKEPDGHIRVWTKCLLQKDLDSTDFNGKILDNVTRKVVLHYVPPIATVMSFDATQNIAITKYEETANIGNLQPQSNIFYELNCSERMLRELSIYVNVNGRRGRQSK